MSRCRRNRRRPRLGCVVLGELLIERDEPPVAVWPGGAERRGTSNCSASRLIQIRKARLRGKLVSDVLFCFPALRCHVLSPCRSSRCCGAPKPGKEKQKSYDYRSAILMVHRFRSFLSVFTPVLRKIWREVTRKMQKTCEPRITRLCPGYGGQAADITDREQRRF